jgi:hypothetical protein
MAATSTWVTCASTPLRDRLARSTWRSSSAGRSTLGGADRLRLQPPPRQQVFHQRVELVDVALYALSLARPLLAPLLVDQQLSGEAKAHQGGAQLVRHGQEQLLSGLDQPSDAALCRLCRPVALPAPDAQPTRHGRHHRQQAPGDAHARTIW